MPKKSLLAAVSALTIAFSIHASAADSPTKTGYAPVRGLKIYYELRGVPDPKKPPLVLLHGGGSTIMTSFGSVIEEFAKDRQVIAFEQQGHGHTADIGKPFSFESSADDAAALLDYLNIPRADFFGYSNGGHIALKIAERHPKIVNKLVIASAMVTHAGAMPGFWDGFKTASVDNMPEELKEAYRKVAPHPDQLKSFHDKSVRRMVEFKDWTPQQLKAIQAPTLILLGDHDIVTPEHGVEMYRQMPHAELAILPGLDHMKIVENWPVGLIERFLDEPAAPGRPASDVSADAKHP